MPTVGVDGTRFYYEESGSGAPLVFVHDTGGSTASFAAAMASFASSHRAIVYDRRGFGRTDVPPAGPKDYVRAHAKDLACLLRELGATNVTLLGHGFGAIVALGAAAFYPDLAVRVVLFDPLFRGEGWSTPAQLGTVGGTRVLGKLGLQKKAAARFLRWLHGRDVPPADAASVLAEVKGGIRPGHELDEPELARVKSAVAFVLAPDARKEIAASVERLRAILRGSRIVMVEHGDHGVAASDPAAFVDAVRRALG